MKARLVTVYVLMPDEPGTAGKVSGNLGNIRPQLGALDYVTKGPGELVEVNDLRGFEVDWEDWFDVGS